MVLLAEMCKQHYQGGKQPPKPETEIPSRMYSHCLDPETPYTQQKHTPKRKTDKTQKHQLKYETHLKNPLQPSQVMALKWKPVALSPQTPQILGALRSNSSGPTTDVVTVMGSITKEKREKTVEVTTAAPCSLGHKNSKRH